MLVIAVLLSLFAIRRIWRELESLDTVKAVYLDQTRQGYDHSKSWFRFETIGYLTLLTFLSFAHLVILILARNYSSWYTFFKFGITF
ncbi:hypothetical protein D1BOALGB6SA_7522 [Olavius sp. associated proteobacterium Delta 1]|nr:hypothetical protein D1BOALGB6SA_7522 [Olavius sp. associated proteobacterium Delta 1]